MSETVKPDSGANLNIASENKTSLDQFIDWSSEWFSSILVKESRQALKSRQFLYTFFGLMLIVVCWSIGALTYVQSDDGNDVTPGPFLLFGFWLILGFPLAIVIPFATFRSLAHEFEDGTLQLVSITTMRPYQIISGKLGVAVLQIFVYLSVLAPCIAFTYLLRGIDLRQIWWGLMIAVTGSISLCMVGLFLASVTRSRQFGTVLSVLLLFALAWVYWMWGFAAFNLTYMFSGAFAGMETGQSNVMLFGYLAVIGTSSFLMFAAAAARISFEADNRSTLIRVAMLVQQIFFFGFVVTILAYAFEDDAACFISMFICHYWLIMGSMMAAVPAVMSRRVRRSLPTTTLGRSVKSLFMPGPGRGYLFAIGNIWGWNLLLLIVFALAGLILPEVNNSWGPNSSRSLSPGELGNIMASVFGNCVYATTLLSITFIFLTVSYRRRPNVGPFFGFALVFVIVAIFSVVPIVVQIQWFRRWGPGYTLLQLTNWYTTTAELNNYGLNAGEAMIALVAVGITMCLVGYFALRIAGRELQYLPEAIPNRVMEEEKRRRAKAAFASEDMGSGRHPLDD